MFLPQCLHWRSTVSPTAMKIPWKVLPPCVPELLTHVVTFWWLLKLRAPLASQELFAASADSWTKQVSFKSLAAWPPLTKPQLCTAFTTVTALNMANLDSMPSEVKNLWHVASARGACPNGFNWTFRSLHYPWTYHQLLISWQFCFSLYAIIQDRSLIEKQISRQFL